MMLLPLLAIRSLILDTYARAGTGELNSMRVPTGRRSAASVLFLIGLALLSEVGGSGCDKGAKDVPTYGDSSEDLGIPSISYTQPRKSSEWVLILPAEDLADYRLLDHVIQTEAGKHHWAFHVERPTPIDPPGMQAKLIRAAVGRGVSSMIVVPEDQASDLVDALEFATDKKTPIVLLEQNVPVKGQPIPAILFASYEKPSQQLVKALLEDCEMNKLPADFSALLVQRIPGDIGSASRISAIEAELKKANVPIAEKLTFRGVTVDAKRAIDDAIQRHRNVGMIVCDEDQGLNAAAQAVGANQRLAENDPKVFRFSVAGFIISKSRLVLVENGSASAVADRGIVEMAKQAVDHIASITDGKPVPLVTFQKSQFHRRSAETLESLRIRKQRMNKSSNAEQK
jgi:ABC-type sugar transport system substrate-binding protein